MIGCLRKLQRFFLKPSRRTVLLALDHGLSEGMTPGIAKIPELLANADKTGLQGVILNKGLARAHAASLSPEVLLVVQLSAGTRHGIPSYNKSVVCSIPEAQRLGADAVCMQLNIGNDLEDRMLSDFGMVTDEAHLAGLPVIAVLYPRGGQIVNEFDSSLISHCIRLGGELGADLICTPFSNDAASFGEAIAASPAPVLVAGGPSQPEFDGVLRMLKEALECGASGVTIGRNIFQRPNSEECLEKIVKLVHGEE